MAAARKTKKTAASKSSRRKPSTKRKKASGPVKAAKPAAQKKKTIADKKSKPTTGRNSVDSILVRFEKQRTEQQSKLSTVRKKIAQLEAKTKAFQAEIVSLKAAESNAETTLGKLDSQRDQAVRDLLKKLGVSLVGETDSQSSRRPEAVEAKPPLDTVFRCSTNSNGNSPAAELSPNSSSDELLDDDLLDDDHN